MPVLPRWGGAPARPPRRNPAAWRLRPRPRRPSPVATVPGAQARRAGRRGGAGRARPLKYGEGGGAKLPRRCCPVGRQFLQLSPRGASLEPRFLRQRRRQQERAEASVRRAPWRAADARAEAALPPRFPGSSDRRSRSAPRRSGRLLRDWPGLAALPRAASSLPCAPTRPRPHCPAGWRRPGQQRQQEPSSMMKFKPNQTRTYDREGFKKRAACLCFRSEQEDEVRAAGVLGPLR